MTTASRWPPSIAALSLAEPLNTDLGVARVPSDRLHEERQGNMAGAAERWQSLSRAPRILLEALRPDRRLDLRLGAHGHQCKVVAQEGYGREIAVGELAHTPSTWLVSRPSPAITKVWIAGMLAQVGEKAVASASARLVDHGDRRGLQPCSGGTVCSNMRAVLSLLPPGGVGDDLDVLLRRPALGLRNAAASAS